MTDAGHFEDLANQLERDALALERTADLSRVHLLFRTVHNLKSSLAQLERGDLAEWAHRLEDDLDQIRRGRERWTSLHCDRVMGLVDRIRAMEGAPAGIRALEGPEAPPEAEAAVAPRWGVPLSPGEVAAVEAGLAQGLSLFRLDKLFRRGLSQEAFASLPVLEDLQELGTLVAAYPDYETYAAGPDEQVVHFLFLTDRSEAALAEVLWDPLIPLEQGARAGGPAPAELPLRFLVVEDDPTAGGLLSYILGQRGTCLLAETGAEALEALEVADGAGTPYDMVILDLFLPDVHGDEILRIIREQEARRGVRGAEGRSVVLINTASRDMHQLRQSLDLEPDGYLLKPIHVEALLQRVDQLRQP